MSKSGATVSATVGISGVSFERRAMLKASTRSFPLLMAPAGRVADEPELRPYAGFETQARRRWRAARNDARALPGARALGGMGDAPARRDLLRVIFERGITFQGGGRIGLHALNSNGRR